MGHFSGIEDAEVYERGAFLTPGGSYDLHVNTMLVKETRKRGLAFIVEFTVDAVSGKEAEEKHAVGSKATWFQKMQDKDVAFPAIKEFFMFLLKIDKTDQEALEEFNSGLEDLLEEMTSWESKSSDDRHPLAGEKIHVDTYTKITKKGLEFTAHNWSSKDD